MRIQSLSILFIFLFAWQNSFALVTSTTTQTARFLSLSDIHFDPFYACENKTPCPLINALRSAPVSAWATLFAKYDTKPAQYNADTNYPLLKSALAASGKIAAEEQVNFVLILGDFLGHDYRDQYIKFSKDKSRAGYQTFVHKTLQFISQQIHANFPDTEIFPALGNNDAYRDYQVEANGNLLHSLTADWSNFMTDQNRARFQKQFAYAGYYAVTPAKQPNLKIIMLNTVLFSSLAPRRNTSRLALEQLNWFHQELLRAKNNNQKVMIAMHIPMGIDVYATLRLRLFTLIEFWRDPYLKRFSAELNEFAPIITSVFAGHLHADWFRIMTVPDSKIEIPINGVPGVSPIFGNNPGFKIYHYGADDLQLKNFSTYYYPLDSDGWKKEYDFDRIYSSNCKDCSLLQGMNFLKEANHLAGLYRTYYSLGTNSQPITTKWSPYYWCAIKRFDVENYKKCIQKEGL